MRRSLRRPHREVVIDHPLTAALQFYRRKLDKSQADISRDCWLDESYISRLLRGERIAPSRDALILLTVFGLELEVHEADDVLMAADYKTLVLASAIR